MGQPVEFLGLICPDPRRYRPSQLAVLGIMPTDARGHSKHGIVGMRGGAHRQRGARRHYCFQNFGEGGGTLGQKNKEQA